MESPLQNYLRESISLDIYPPEPLVENDHSSLVVLILQGVEIDKLEYAAIAKALNRHQYWVVVPNCYPAGKDYLCPENDSASKVIAALQLSASQELVQAMQRGIILLGHSAGGMAALSSSNDNFPEISRLVAIATYGSNTPFKMDDNSLVSPVLMLSGQKDSIVSKQLTKNAFQRITAPKTFIELTGVNHYGINNSPQPIGAPSENNNADLSNSDSVDLIASLLCSFIEAINHQDQNWVASVNNDIFRLIADYTSVWTD